MPSSKIIFNPLTGKSEELGKTEQYKWMNDFFQELKRKRKVAIRRGVLSDDSVKYTFKLDAVNRVIAGIKSGKKVDIRSKKI